MGAAAEIVPVVAIIVTGFVLLGKFVFLPAVHIMFGGRGPQPGMMQSTESEADRRKIERLEAELQELKDRLNEQAILIDDQRLRQRTNEDAHQTISG
ncbi:MAG: hypothetical protein IT203_03100 [Fimbriimonadaceae bacterium]|nr:hypothetical protein [Fimbriimonadaceae bacterium]